MLTNNQIKNLFKGKIILITGGLGSIGSEIAKQLLNYNPKEIRIIDNREAESFYEIIKPTKFFFADIRDKERLLQVMDSVNIVFHTAALKHVPICQYNPFETVKTNVLGTKNVIECAFKCGVDRMILISTDKAVNPTSVMGATKLLMEQLISTMYHNNTGTTKLGVVRFGNVLTSRGSVLEIWKRQLNEGKKITITNSNMTRFFISIPESIKLIFSCSYYAERGEIFILKMPSVTIGDLAKAFLELHGCSENHYESIGVRAGEKLHEKLISENEIELLLESKESFVRLPLVLTEKNQLLQSEEYKKFSKLGFIKSNVKSFSSNNKMYLLNKEEIKKILENVEY